jgi:SAM-dependent methyltransferase
VTADLTAPPAAAALPADTHAQRLLLLAGGMRLAAIVHALCALGVADQLAAGPRPVGELAAAVEADPPSLARLLRAAASVGVFALGADGRVELTPLAEGLRSEGPQSIRALVLYSAADFIRGPYGHLLHSVRTGEPATGPALGRGLWAHLDRTPADADLFDRSMAGMSGRMSGAFADRIRPERFGRIADIGGGTGEFLAELLHRAPRARGVLVERPAVARAAEVVLIGAGVADRVEIVGGDFTAEPVPAGCDAYVLRTILHNWPDETAAAVLRRVRDRLADGRLFVCEQVVSDQPGWDHAKLLDIDMLAVFGGRERTLAEWERLLDAAGLALAARPERPGWTVLECVAAPGGGR